MIAMAAAALAFAHAVLAISRVDGFGGETIALLGILEPGADDMLEAGADGMHAYSREHRLMSTTR